MARLPRLFIEGCPAILGIQAIRGLPVLASVNAANAFLKHIEKASKDQDLPIHAFCMTPDAVVLMASPKHPKHLGKFVQQVLQQSHVPIKNLIIAEKHHQFANLNDSESTGPLWLPRFRSTVVQPGHQALVAQWCVEHWIQMQQTSIEVLHYPFSSYAAHAGTSVLPWLVDAAEYWALGNTPFERQQAYQYFGKQHIKLDDLLNLKKHLLGGWLWSEADFAEHVAQTANRRVKPLSAGRPRENTKFE